MSIPITPSNDADEALNTELARANLARLRGDYNSAERQCLDLLKHTPNNANVAALLGDVSAEQGKLDEAIQWYELAVGAGATSGIEEKLDAMRIRVNERDSANSQRDIGLPQQGWLTAPILVGGLVIVVMLLVGAYVAGTYRTPTKVTAPIAEQAPIVLPPTTVPIVPPDSTAKPPTTDAAPVQATPPSPSSSKAAFDVDVQSVFLGATGPLARASAAIANPRDHSVTIDVPVETGGDPRGLAAQVAESAMPALKDAATVTVRVSGDGQAVFVADCTRDRYEAYAQANKPASDTAGLADALLTNEWRAGTDAPPTGR